MSNRGINRKFVKKLKISTEDSNGDSYKCELDLDSSVVANIDSKEYKLTARNLNVLKKLGSGNYGSVDLRIHDPSQTIMAVKVMQISEEDKRNLKREIDVLKSSSGCPNVVRFHGAFFHEGTAFICMEAMDMCLTKFYKTVFSKMFLQSMPENVLGAVTVSVLRALDFLKRELRVMHRDVKPSNILINNCGEIKMCDFGISGCLVDSRAKSYVGCIRYMAPELFDTEQRTNDGYDIRSDVWSLGITLLEISSGKVVYQEFEAPYAFMDHLKKNNPPVPLPVYSEEFVRFISLCLQKDFRERPYLHELLSHEYSIQHSESIDDGGYKEFVRKVIANFDSS